MRTVCTAFTIADSCLRRQKQNRYMVHIPCSLELRLSPDTSFVRVRFSFPNIPSRACSRTTHYIFFPEFSCKLLADAVEKKD